MKKRNEVAAALIPMVITISLFVVFYEKIECRPNHAGFWLILVMGASIGVAITRLSQRTVNKKD